jgi:hypothetical protein
MYLVAIFLIDHFLVAHTRTSSPAFQSPWPKYRPAPPHRRRSSRENDAPAAHDAADHLSAHPPAKAGLINIAAKYRSGHQEKLLHLSPF